MAKKDKRSKVLGFVAWFTGVVVSLVVGNGMIQGTLNLPRWLGGSTAIGSGIAMVIGWIVVITTIVSVVLAIISE